MLIVMKYILWPLSSTTHFETFPELCKILCYKNLLKLLVNKVLHQTSVINNSLNFL